MGRVLVSVCAVLLCVSAAEGAIRHQYTFNDGTVEDLVGTRDGTIVDPDGLGLFVGGQFDMTANEGFTSDRLNPGAMDPTGVYIDLGNNLVTEALAAGTVNAASFEMWVTSQTNRTWARIFDFGASNGGEDISDSGADQDYIFLGPSNSPGQPPGVGPNDFAFSSHAPADAGDSPETYIGIPNVNGADPQPLPTGVEHHIVVTYDQTDTSAGCPVNHVPCNMGQVQPNGTVNVYLNGELAAVGPVNPDMLVGSLENEVNDWLGRSQWGGDPLFDGSFNEFRVYDHVLSEAEVEANFMEGPVPAPVPTIVVNRETGNITIENQSGGAQQLIGYAITSAAGGLNISSWDPIAPASGWTIDSQTEDELGESGPAQAINPGGMINLGGAWIPTIFEDLQFAYEFQGGASGLGAVQYEGNNGVAYGRSDLDTDGDVDADDWILFLAGNKTDLSALSDAASYLKGDLNNDGNNNHADFLLFRNDFIAAQGGAAFAALVSGVPEPTSLVMIALAMLAGCGLRLRSVRRVLPVVAVATLLCVLQGEASADLVHRYSFDEGAAADATNRTIVDSVGNADGTVLGAGSSATADDLVLAGGASDTQAYVDLPNGLISQYTDITFEAWYTMSSVQNWTRVFDFGSNTAGEQTGPGGTFTALDNFFMAPARATNISQQRIGFGNNDPLFLGSDPPGAGTVAGCCQDLDPNVPQAIGETYHIVVTFDEDGGSGAGLGSVTVYHNGGIAGGAAANPRVDITTKLANLNDVNNWLGRSNWNGDSNFAGTFHEFRIYDHPLSAEAVAFNSIVGPDVVSEPGPLFSLEVNTTSGNVRIKNNLPVELAFNYYEINSAGGALNPGGWNSLDDQEGGDPPGQGWDQSGGSDDGELVELFLGADGFTLGAGAELNLGSAFDPSVFGAGNDGDLAFNFGLLGGTLLAGEVNYTSVVAQVDGDYNGDGVVNAADYVLWRNGGPLQNDPTPGVQAADYDFWVARFGNTSGSGSGGAAIPEPATWLCLVAGLGLALARRRH